MRGAQRNVEIGVVWKEVAENPGTVIGVGHIDAIKIETNPFDNLRHAIKRRERAA